MQEVGLQERSRKCGGETPVLIEKIRQLPVGSEGSAGTVS